MKKISEINEGLWDGIVDRGTTGNVRKEDKSTIDKMKPIDLGDEISVYMADIDYEEGGKDHFTWDEAMEINERIKDTGWRLPYGSKEICDIFFTDRHLPHIMKNSLRQEWDYKKFWASIWNATTGEKLEFELDNHNGYAVTDYWCDWERPLTASQDIKTCPSAREFLVGDSGISYGNVIGTNNARKSDLNKIRLVKDK